MCNILCILKNGHIFSEYKTHAYFDENCFLKKNLQSYPIQSDTLKMIYCCEHEKAHISNCFAS